MKTSIIVSWVLPTSVVASDIQCTEGNTLFQSSVVSTAVIEDNGEALIEDNGAAELDIKDDAVSEAVAAGTRRLVPQQCNPHEAAQELEGSSAGGPLQRRHKVLINREVFIDRSLEDILNEHDEDINQCKSVHPDGRPGDHWIWQTWHGRPYTTKSNPLIKVCGNSIKITVFPESGCRRHRPAVVIGSCDAHAPPSTCCEYDPSALNEGFMPGSYIVESCGPHVHRLLQTLDPAAGNQEPLEVAHPLALSQMVQPHSQSLESMEARDEGMLVQTSQESGEGKQLETLSESKAKNTLMRTKLDIHQKVIIQGAPVLGGGVGDSQLGRCIQLAPWQIADQDAPKVTVCGTSIRANFYLRNRCENYYEHSLQLGQCDKKMPPWTCVTHSPVNDARFGTYQSYSIQLCD